MNPIGNNTGYTVPYTSAPTVQQASPFSLGNSSAGVGTVPAEGNSTHQNFWAPPEGMPPSSGGIMGTAAPVHFGGAYQYNPAIFPVTAATADFYAMGDMLTGNPALGGIDPWTTGYSTNGFPSASLPVRNAFYDLSVPQTTCTYPNASSTNLDTAHQTSECPTLGYLNYIGTLGDAMINGLSQGLPAFGMGASSAPNDFDEVNFAFAGDSVEFPDIQDWQNFQN